MCDLTKKEAQIYYEECKNSARNVLEQIKQRLSVEKVQSKIEVLLKIVSVLDKN